MSKLNAALGLYHLHDGQFKAAADCFAKVSFELNNTFNDVSLCAKQLFALVAAVASQLPSDNSANVACCGVPLR